MPLKKTNFRLGFLVLLLALTQIKAVAQYPAGADSVLQFIKEHPNNSALFLKRNDTALAKLNETVAMPLASTCKIMVAIEFAKQAGNDIIESDSMVALADLDRYYLPYTDGGAHYAWLQQIKKNNLVKNDSIALIHVARGMIQFSSNANTEYLMDLLGLDNINNNIQLFGLQNHTALFPFVSSLFLYQNPKKSSEKKILRAIDDLTEEAYCKTSFEIHKALKYDTILKSRFKLADLSLNMQKKWSDRLPASTVKDYVQICTILNKRKYLDENSYGVLAEVLESLMENPANQKIYHHIGTKGGSTSFVLTKAIYAQLIDLQTIEVAYFFNDLTANQNQQLQKWLNDFNIAITQSRNFQDLVAGTFKPSVAPKK